LPRQTPKIYTAIEQNFSKISNFHFLYIQNFIVFATSSSATTILNYPEETMKIIVFKFHKKTSSWYSAE